MATKTVTTAQKAAKSKRPESERGRRLREILPPEGVPLQVELADRGERAAAVLIDLLIMIALFIGAGLGLLALLFVIPPGWGLALFLVAFFLVRNFYFSYFEIKWRGQTPGKRLLGLRVIDRNGGHLKAEAVFARNLTREIELFMPIALLLSPAGTGLGALLSLATLAWVAIFLLMPLFNRDSLRAGDMVAGTWVISVPKAVLHADLTSVPAQSEGQSEGADTTAPTSAYHFTDQQLDIYGIYELQTLESVLRRDDARAAETRAEVSNRIRQKIGYTAEVDADRFLHDFYAALRKRLESRMLLGHRRESKHG